MLLSELLSVERIKVPLNSSTKQDVLRELLELMADGRPAAEVTAMLESVEERERVLSTGIGDGVAIPHGKTPYVSTLMLAAGVAPRPIDFDALDGMPVRLFFLLVGPERASGAHVKTLSRISRLLRRDRLRAELLSAGSPQDFMRTVRDSEAA